MKHGIKGKEVASWIPISPSRFYAIANGHEITPKLRDRILIVLSRLTQRKLRPSDLWDNNKSAYKKLC